MESASGDPGSGRRELAGLLLAGAVGAGLVLLGTRQPVAKVIVTAPRPLPVTITAVNGQVLLPAIAALAVAALASLAAVLATRGLARRITGLVTAALGAGVIIVAAAKLRAADVLTAAGHANISPANGAGGGIAPGSTTAGANGGAGGSLAGFPAHVAFAGSTWRVLILAGAALIIIAGFAIIARATKLPAMSSRYERAARPPVPQPPVPQPPGPQPPGPQPPGPRKTATRAAASVAAGMWDSLTAGTDPTVASGDDDPS